MTAGSSKSIFERRAILRSGATAAAIGLVSYAAATPIGKARAAAHKSESAEAEVTPGEDLMQEHGVLERVLLVYDEAARRIERSRSLDLAVVAGAAGIIRRFVEEYHEKLEEQFVFPRLQAAGREVNLVTILLQQHQVGRQVTDEIARRAADTATPALAQALRSFVRMYRPHAAREDTVVFPAFRDVVGGSQYRELGEKFEDEEHRRFGKHGFEQTVAQVAQLEAALDIADLAQFTVREAND
jgi:hemerythrin-like domain-containing protein